MNRKQLSILLVLLVVVGVAGLVVHNKQNEARRGGNAAIGKKLLPDLPVNDIAQISIRQGTNEVVLAKQEELWRVQQRNNYPANYQEIRELLLKLRDLKIVQAERVGTSQLPRLGLGQGDATNSATVVDFKDKSGKTLQSLYLGKKHMRKSNRPSPFGDMGDEGWPDGRYVRTGISAETVALVSDTLANLEPKPEQWLNKDFFKVEKVRTIGVEFPSATNSWELARETESGEWKLANPKPGEQLDTSKASSATSSLSSPSFSDVAPAAKAEEMGLGKPTVVKIGTFDNFTYNLKVGTKTNDSYPLMVSVSASLPTERVAATNEAAADKEKLDKEFKEKQKTLTEKLEAEKKLSDWVFLVSSWTLDSVLKERSQLLVEKKEEPKADSSTNAAPAVLQNELPTGDAAPSSSSTNSAPSSDPKPPQ